MDYIHTLLSDDDKLEAAVLVFNQVKPTESPESSVTPHNISNFFTDEQQWTKTEKIGLAAAIFKATALTSFDLSTTQDSLAEIGEATNLLFQFCIPLVTMNTEPGNRLESVNKNIEEVKLQIINEPESQPQITKNEETRPVKKTSQDNNLEGNHYAFFSALAVGITLATTVAIALTR